MLRLVFERRGNTTLLRRCRYKVPLQALSPLVLDEGTCYLLLLNPTGGVLGGDQLRTEITLEEGARVCLSTPSATRVYRTTAAPADIGTILHIGRCATVEYVPDHAIPHAGSSLCQTMRVEMEEGSRGIFFDSFAAGRVALNERWLFRNFDSRIEIFLRGRRVYLSRTRIFGTPRSSPSSRLHAGTGGAATPVYAWPPWLVHPDGIPSERSEPKDLSCSLPLALGCMGEYSYSGSLVVVADDFSNWLLLLKALRSALDGIPGIFGGASLLAGSGCTARFLAPSAIALHDATQHLWAVSRRHLLGLPPLALRKY